jgi:hypothetical protein
MFSLKGFVSSLKHQFDNSSDQSLKLILLNLINFNEKLISEYGLDVCYSIPKNKILLNNFEKQKYSQFKEDGITEKIFEVIGTTNKFYLDFGGTETTNNSEVLHKEHGFSGVLWNGEDLPCEYTKIHKEYITLDNILELCDKYEVPKDFDFLSIDIDGNDWYIWKKMCENGRCRPRVVVIEYNATFPPPEDKIVEYKEEFNYDLTIYHSASIQSMYNLGRHLGYSLVAAESMGYNLFFIRDDVVGDCFYGTNDVKFLYKTPKLGHRPCSENGLTHTPECLKIYRPDGILGHKPDLLNRPWVTTNNKNIFIYK